MGDLMSLIKANNITNVTGGIPTVKSQQLIPTAWVNFNGTGTVAIAGSEGVSSITDNGAGSYWINFSTTMANTNYCIAGTSRWTGYDNWVQHDADPLTTAFKVGITKGGSLIDSSLITISVLGGQA